MAKTKVKTAFFCQSCGSQYPKWVGKCTSCNEWNTYVEEIVNKENINIEWENKDTVTNTPSLISDINYLEDKRYKTEDYELNRVLGGGIVPGSIILLGGEPGVGKSTLMLQIALNLHEKKVLYISGEESEKQIKMRADRICKKFKNCFVLTETSTRNIFQQLKKIIPEILIIDSIQTLHSSLIEATPGSVSQIKACTGELLKFAKKVGFKLIPSNEDNIILMCKGADSIIEKRLSDKVDVKVAEKTRMHL